jgi:hypothetical protein
LMRDANTMYRGIDDADGFSACGRRNRFAQGNACGVPLMCHAL